MARLEKQNPSVHPSVLSHSVVDDDDRNDLNQRAASSLEHVSEEGGPDRESVYNVIPNDIAAIPQKQSPKKSERSAKRAARGSEAQGHPSVRGSLNMQES